MTEVQFLEITERLLLQAFLGVVQRNRVVYVRDDLDSSMLLRHVKEELVAAGPLEFEVHPAFRPQLSIT
ncbi:MAG TPA: hypothetical protein VF137_09065 [Candidatus Dormibacteraeota bacterium]